MPTPAISDEALNTAVEYVNKHNGSISEAAKALGIPRQTLAGRYKKALMRAQTPVATPVEPTPPVDKDVLAIRRLRDTIEQLQRNRRELEDRVIRSEAQLETLLDLRKATVEPSGWIPTPAVHRKTVLLPMLMTSDFQAGEVIDAEEIDGMNSYNLDIFQQRYYAMIERTDDMATHHVGNAEFTGIYYLRGGDAISGGIHPELAESDSLSSIPAVRYLVRTEYEGIKALRARFGRVHVVSIPGNHGRNTFKPRAKGYVDHSYESIISWWLADKFADDPMVTFDTPKSGDGYFKAEGWRILLSHGDRMGSRGGQGFIGPAATIARGHQKLYANYTASGRQVDVILTGHLHTSLKLSHGYANGALAGYSEYARDIRALPDAAKQWLLFMHRTRCVSQAIELQLSDRPQRNVAYDDFEG